MNILNLNVCGLLSKLDNEVFVEECLKHEVLCLCECKTREVEEEKVQCKLKKIGYKAYVKSRKNTKAKSGGLVIAVKECYEDIIRYRKVDEDIMQAVFLSKNYYTLLTIHYYITFTYLPRTHCT